MKLLFKAIEQEKFDVRAKDDHRKRVNWLCVSYVDPNGIEYRRSYEFPRPVSYDRMITSFPRVIEQ